MAEGTGGNTSMGIVLGAILVIVILIGGFFVFGSGMMGGGTKSVDVNVSAPKVPTPGG